MPVYEFHCNKCNIDFEYLVLGKNDLPQCSKCGTTDITKQFSVFGFTSGDKTVTSSSGSGCSTCGTHNCSTCG